MDCKKCFKKLHTCPACGGSHKHVCTPCNNTGLVCPDHGGFHGR